MPYSVPSSTKILTMATAPFLFKLASSVSACLWICYGARCVHFAVPSGRRGGLFFLRAEMYTFSSTFIKDLNLCLPRYYYGKVIVELEKTQTRNLNVFVVHCDTFKKTWATDPGIHKAFDSTFLSVLPVNLCMGLGAIGN